MDKATLVRLIVFALAWVNAALAQKGLTTLPVLDETQVAFAVTFIVSLWTAVRHNFLGKKGKIQKEVLEQKNLK